MEAEDRIERTLGLVMLAVLAIVLRPFFTAICFALILMVASWLAFEGLQHLLGGRGTLAAILMVTLATLVFVVPPALIRANGKRLGRPTVPASVEHSIRAARQTGKGQLAIARELGVGVSTVRRVLGAEAGA